MFSGDFREWTIDPINSSPIITLLLWCCALLREMWANILPRLILPSLHNLTITFCTVESHHLVSFIARHPSIIKLSLLIAHINSFASPQSLDFAGSDLIELIATPESICVLLKSPTAFPNLTHVVIKPSSNGDDYSSEPLDDSLATLIQRAGNLSLSLHILAMPRLRMGSPTWSRAGRAAPPLRHTTDIANLGLKDLRRR
jgi:hypothetical protein